MHCIMKHISAAVLCGLIVALAVVPALAQDPPEPPELPPGMLEATGTHFVVTNRDAQTVTIESSNTVQVFVMYGSQVLAMHIEGVTGTTSTQLSISGLEPSTTLQKYEDSFTNRVAFDTGASGSYSFTQDLSSPHLIIVQPSTSTIYLTDSGWSKPVGDWDPVTRTATLTQNVYETIEISANDITLDGNGHVCDIGGNWGIYISGRHGATVGNLTIINAQFAIFASGGNNVTIRNNEISGAYVGVARVGAPGEASGNVITSVDYGVVCVGGPSEVNGNVISNVDCGIFFEGVTNSLLSNNIISVALVGLDLQRYVFGTTIQQNRVTQCKLPLRIDGCTETNVITDNDFESTESPFLLLNDCGSVNLIYNNNFTWPPGYYPFAYGWNNQFNMPKPVGGNYWSHWTTPDADGDGFVDIPYAFEHAQDALPYALKSGWRPRPVPDVDPLPDLVGECSVIVTVYPTATDHNGNTIEGTTTDPLEYGQGTYTIHWTYTDADGNSSFQDQNVIVEDTQWPSISHAEVTVSDLDDECSATVTFAPDVTDNCPDVTYAPTQGTFPLGTTDVTLTATDLAGHESHCTFTVTVENPSPVVTITGPPSGAIYAVGTPVDFTATFTDENGGTHTALWKFNDVIDLEGTVDDDAGTVTGSYAFASAGVYLVTLNVTDQCSGTGTATTVDGLDAMVVVYDPSVGFVTGGGWIDSPPGAYAPDATLTGKANLGFVSKYQTGATTPTGQTEFRFRVADLNFHSTSYDWLVMGGPKAKYKGDGTINGEGDYGFMLTAIDGQINGGGGEDKFRMKIVDKDTDTVVYDNMMGQDDSDDPTTVLGGGSIVIHRSDGDAPAATTPGETILPDPDPVAPLPSEYALLQNHPNPFNPTTHIQFELPANARVNLIVYDVSGRLVKRLVDRWMAIGRHSLTWDGTDGAGRSVSSGVYFYRIQAGDFRATKRMVLLK